MENNQENKPKEIAAITISTSISDPLLQGSEEEMKNIVENELENDLENTGENISERLKKEEENAENALEWGQEDVENNSENSPERSEKDAQEEAENDWGTFEEDISTIETASDPLLDEEQDIPKVTAEEYIEDEEVPESFKELLDEMGMAGLEMLDDMKVSLCVAIGGGHPAQYAAKKKVLKTFYRASTNLMKHKEFKAPSPEQAFLIALAMVVLPAIGTAAWNKYTKKNVVDIPQKNEAVQAPSDSIDYKQTKEYRQERKRFKVFASSGAYMYILLDGEFKYVSADHSDDFPSPEIQKLLDEGKSSSEITKIVYG